MPLPHRIAAGAIIVNQSKILLVRYADAAGGSYLVSLGGAVEGNEGLADAAIRETQEETGITVAVRRPLAIEYLICTRYHMCKVWFLCDYVSGEVQNTHAAAKEGITQAAWFRRDALAHEVVFPSILLAHDWASLGSSEWIFKALEVRKASF